MKPKGKAGALLRSLVFLMREAVAQAETRLLKGYPVFTGWNVARVLALGALLSAGTAMYFSMASEGGASAPTTAGREADARPVKSDSTYLGLLNNDDERTYGPPYVETFSPEAKPGSPAGPSREYIPEDELWVAPYYEFFSEDPTNALVPQLRIIPDDEWRYGPPYMDKFDVDDEATGAARGQTGCHLKVEVRRNSAIVSLGPDGVHMQMYLEIAGHHCTADELEAALGRLPWAASSSYGAEVARGILERFPPGTLSEEQNAEGNPGKIGPSISGGGGGNSGPVPF